MSETLPAVSAPGSLPAGYREVLYWTITGKPARIIAMQVLALPLFAIFGLIFGALTLVLARAPSFRFDAFQCVALPAGIALTMVLHELVHGLVMQVWGARPRYGVLLNQLVFYATAPGFAFRRTPYLAVALAPLAGLSVLAVAGMLILAGTPWIVVLALCAAVNGAGAIGDLWIAAIVLRYPAHAYVIDERDGIRVFLP